jgi:DNA-binding NarL/FixJ family response regulator
MIINSKIIETLASLLNNPAYFANNSTESNRLLLVTIVGILILIFPYQEVMQAIKNLTPLQDKLIEIPLEIERKNEIEPLTTREKEVLSLMSKGKMNKQIAKDLFISDATVKNHVTSVLRKLNATVRTEAVVTAIRQGLV